MRAHNHFLAWLCSKVKVEMGHIHYIESGGSAQLSSTVFENQQKSRIFQKTRQNWLFLAFLMNFCPLKM